MVVLRWFLRLRAGAQQQSPQTDQTSSIRARIGWSGLLGRSGISVEVLSTHGLPIFNSSIAMTDESVNLCLTRLGCVCRTGLRLQDWVAFAGLIEKSIAFFSHGRPNQFAPTGLSIDRAGA